MTAAAVQSVLEGDDDTGISTRLCRSMHRWECFSEQISRQVIGE